MAASQSEPRLRRRLYAELWTSFAALIRSYVAATDLARPLSGHTLVDEGESGHLTLRGDRKALGLDFDAVTGAGSWTVYEDDLGPEQKPNRVLERGEFEIGEDSRVGLSGRMGKMEMDAAAEIFTAKVF